MIQFVVNGIVPSKSNTYGFGKGNFYKAAKVRQYEADFAWQTKNVKKNTFEKDDKLYICYKCYVGNMAQDVDNILKTINDSLQKTEIIKNDKRIILHRAYKQRDKENPRVEIKIRKLWGKDD